MARTKVAQPAWLFTVILGVTIGGILLFLYSLPYPWIKSWIDSLAQDGEVELFMPALFHAVRRFSLPAGMILVVISVTMLAFRKRSLDLIHQAGERMNGFTAQRTLEVRAITRAMRVDREESRYLYALLGITLLGALNRAVYLLKPMGHDETYTFMAFATQGFKRLSSDYHLPNNHVFHTLLVFLSTELFGIAPWAVRLPAFLAGVLLVPAIYLVGRVFYGKRTGLLSAGLAAGLPVLTDYATNARGYSLIALFALLILAIGAFLKDNKNLVAWAALILVSALGFYTIPIMLYPFGIVMVWLLLSALRNDVAPEYGRSFLVYLFMSGILVLLLITILYLPILAQAGLDALAGNNFIESLSWDEFTESLLPRIRNTWQEWNRGIPFVGSIVFLLGLLAAGLNSESRHRSRARLVLAAFLWLVPVLFIQRVAPWPRVWLFLLPFVLIFAAAGLAGLVEELERRFPSRKAIGSLILAAGLALPLCTASITNLTVWARESGEVGQVERTALFLKDYLGPQDVVVTTSPDGVILRYYFRLHGLPADHTDDIRRKAYRRAVVVVNQGVGQTLESVVEKRAFEAHVDLASASLVYQTGGIQVFALSP